MTSTSGDHQRSTTRLPELAVGLFIVATSIGGAFVWQRSVEAGTAVLVTARSVSRGDVVTRADMTSVILQSSADIALIRTTSLQQVVGMRATTDLPPGTPLTPSLLSVPTVVGPLEGLVGFTVSLSAAPVELAPGDFVRIFSADPTSDGSTLVEEVPAVVQVWDISAADEFSSERAVSLRIPLSMISAVIGKNEIHLVKVVK